MKIEIGTEININQFKQLVRSFFRENPDKGKHHLTTHVMLHSNLDYDAFCIWRKLNRSFR